MTQMAQESISANSHLLPEKYPQKELFICDVADAVLKDIMPQMEHPFYSLSKKPDIAIKRYENNGSWLEITPSVKGHATIYDKDILVYCISQIIAKMKRGEQVSRRVKINTYEFLVFTNRGTGGKDYKALCESLDRLAGTRIVTNIQSGDEEQRDSFGLIETSSIRRKHGLDGRMLWCEIQLSDWVFNAIRNKEVLTLHPDYFRLSKPLEKRIYEIARKHCGQQYSWAIGLGQLHKKTGSKSPMKVFKQLIKNLVRNNHLPDYSLCLESEKVTFINKNHEKMDKWYNPKSDTQTQYPKINERTYELARKVALGYDVYYLEQEWFDFWYRSGRKRLKNPDGAFMAFCKKVYEKNPNP